MIVCCPSCGTRYTHRRRAAAAVRGRCARCAASVDLRALRVYRIRPVRRATAADRAEGGEGLPVATDEPVLAAAVAGRAAAPVETASATRRIGARAGTAPASSTSPASASSDTWDETEPLPTIPEMISEPDLDGVALATSAGTRILEGRREPGLPVARLPEPEAPTGVSAYVLWALGGAILGTGASWTLGGTTTTGLLVGGGTGLTAAWGWLRWASRP